MLWITKGDRFCIHRMMLVLICVRIHIRIAASCQNHTFTHGQAIQKAFQLYAYYQKAAIYCCRVVWIVVLNCGKFIRNDDASERITVIGKQLKMLALITKVHSSCRLLTIVISSYGILKLAMLCNDSHRKKFHFVLSFIRTKISSTYL